MILMLTLSNCSNKILPEKMPKNQIVFGRGGGYTAQIKEYCLLENGKIVELSEDAKQYNVLTTIDADKTTQCFNICKLFKLDEMKFEEPGNLYHFITIKSSKTENKIVWGDKSKPAPSEVVNLHRMLMSYVHNKKDDDEKHEKREKH
jgi:hypothetical protein